MTRFRTMKISLARWLLKSDPDYVVTTGHDIDEIARQAAACIEERAKDWALLLVLDEMSPLIAPALRVRHERETKH